MSSSCRRSAKPTSPDGAWAWDELITSGYDSHVIQTAAGVSNGDVINISTEYFAPGTANGGSNGGIQFGFNNLTTGINSSSAIIHSMGGLPASSFYNGSSGETIDERYSVSGVPQQMRRYGTTFWSNARIYQNGSTA
jgi:hypothetical protein